MALMRNKMNEIRGILFHHPFKPQQLLSETTLNDYEKEIENLGVRESKPYNKIILGIKRNKII